MKKKVGRNEDCPCGSGKKAKYCCGAGPHRRTTSSRLPASRWAPAVFLLVFGGGAIALWHNGQAPPPRPREVPAGAVDNRTVQDGRRQAPDEESETLALAGPNNTLITVTKYTDLPGVSLAGLTGAQKSAVLKRANLEKCSCGCGYTIAGCRHLDTSCGTSLPMAKQLVADAAGS